MEHPGKGKGLSEQNAKTREMEMEHEVRRLKQVWNAASYESDFKRKWDLFSLSICGHVTILHLLRKKKFRGIIFSFQRFSPVFFLKIGFSSVFHTSLFQIFESF